MKTVWLAFVLLVAFVALATSGEEVWNRTNPKPPPRRRFCPGCYTAMSKDLDNMELSFIQAPSPETRTRRETKGSALPRRRGKQRAVTRPVCRGCYSGLMIVAPPDANGSTSTSLESDGDESREGN